MQTKVNRRTALALASGAAATLAVPASAGVPHESGLPALIEAYKTAYAAWEETLDPYEDAHSIWDEQAQDRSIMVWVPGGALEFQTRSHWHKVREEMRERLQRHFADFERRVPPFASKRIQAELLAELRQQKRAAYRQAVTALDDLREAQEKAGLISAIEAYHETYDAQEAASLAILAYPCTTIAECRLKAEFIDQNEGMTSDLVYGGEAPVTAFLQSFLAEPGTATA